MAEENWRVNARGRRVPSRVTSNMRAFTGEKPEGGRDKAGRRYNRADGGTGKRVPISGGTDAARKRTVARNRKAHKRYSGGVNPQVKSGGERKVLKRQGRATATRRYSGGRLVERGPGYQPITSSRFRGRESGKATNTGPTQGGQGLKEFKTGKSPVTTNKGGYAGYRYVKPGSNLPIRQVNPTTTGKPVNRRSGQGRTNTTRPNAVDPKRTGPNRVTGGSRTGKPISGAKSSSAGPNNTGARRTGGGRRGQISSKGGLQTKSGYRTKADSGGRVRNTKIKANTILKGVASLLSRRLNVAMTGYDIAMLGKRDSVLSKALLKLPKTDPKTDAGKILGDKIVSLATAAYKKVKGKVKGSKAKAETPPPKKETKPKRKTKQLVKK